MRLGSAEGDVPTQPRRSRRAALLAADRRGTQSPGGGPALVHDHVRPGQHSHQLAGAAVHARARRDDAAGARGLAGRRPGRLPRRGSGPDPPRDALRRADGVRGAPALAVLRLGRRDAALRCPARRVRALDGGPSARARARGRGAGRAELDRRVRGSPGQRATSGTSAATRRPGSRTSAGRTPGTRSRSGTADCPASHARPASCRATRTTRSSAARASHGSSGRTRLSPTGSRRRPPT